jgi:hypothetical protein
LLLFLLFFHGVILIDILKGSAFNYVVIFIYFFDHHIFIFIFGGDGTGFEVRELEKFSYHLSHIPDPFCFKFIFQNSCFCLGSALDCYFSTSVSQVAGILGLHHHTQLGF